MLIGYRNPHLTDTYLNLNASLTDASLALYPPVELDPTELWSLEPEIDSVKCNVPTIWLKLAAFCVRSYM